jgi:type 1 glutamine amidotransferase
MENKLLCALFAVAMTVVSWDFHPVGSGKTLSVVFVTGDHEYSSEGTMPLMASMLEKRYGFRTTVLKSTPDENGEEDIPGLEALDTADLAVLFLRWRRLPKEQVEHLGKYLDAGKPVVAFRTSTHAFNYPKGHELERWNAFAVDYLGGPPGWGGEHYHYGHLSSTDVRIDPAAANDPILTGVEKNFHAPSWLYQVKPRFPPADAKTLLIGTSVNPETRPGRPAAMENPVAWTWKNKAGGKVFATTLGHPDDFRLESVQRLTMNAIHWALGKKIPTKWDGKIEVDVKYHGIRNTR